MSPSGSVLSYSLRGKLPELSSYSLPPCAARSTWDGLLFISRVGSLLRAYPRPIATHSHLVNWHFLARLLLAFFEDLLRPQNTKYLPHAAVDENLNQLREFFWLLFMFRTRAVREFSRLIGKTTSRHTGRTFAKPALWSF